jgi:hypothetical protein
VAKFPDTIDVDAREAAHQVKVEIAVTHARSVSLRAKLAIILLNAAVLVSPFDMKFEMKETNNDE